VTPRHRRMAEEVLRQPVARHRHERTREALRSSEAERTKRLRDLVELERHACTLAKLYESPAAVLARVGLGSEKRDRYAAQLAHAGPTELPNAARWALATGDRELGAAVMQLAGRVPKDDRLFSSADLAGAMVGAEVKAVQGMLAAARRAVQKCINENRAFERDSRVSGTARIADGLAAAE